MDDLPTRPPTGTPTVTRRMVQPIDETPEIFIKDGIPTSKNPTEAKQRAEFEIDKIYLTFDQRPLLEAANIFREKDDFDGFVNCFKNCDMDMKILGKHLFVTLRPPS